MSPRHRVLRVSVIAASAWAASGCRQTTTSFDAGASPSDTGSSPGLLTADAGGAWLEDASPSSGLASAAEAGAPKPAVVYVSTQDARAAATAAMSSLFGKTTAPDCDALLGVLDVNLGITGMHADAVTRSAFIAFGRCARSSHDWRLLREIGYALTDFDPANRDTGFPAEANEGYARLAAADGDFRDLLRKWPKDGHVYLEAARTSCRMERWTECQKRVEQTLGFQRQKSNSADDEVTLDARILRALALLHTNKVEEASREVDAVAKAGARPKYAEWKARFDELKTTHLWVEPEVDDDVYPDLLPLYGTALLGPFATVRLWNFSGHAVDVKVSLGVDDVTDVASQVVHFTAQKAVVKLTPRARAASATVKGGAGTISLKITDKTGYAPLAERAIAAAVHPASELPTILATGPKTSDETTWRDIRELEAVRIRPGDADVPAWIAAAKAASPAAGWTTKDGASMAHALWDELVRRGVAFSRDASGDSDRGAPIVVRPPAAVLAGARGSELEGVLLFASALESLGLPVVLVNTPGHALVGWLATTDHVDPPVPSPVGPAVFLDPAALGALPFDAAILRADADMVEAIDRDSFTEQRGSIFLLSRLRKAGFTDPAATSQTRDVQTRDGGAPASPTSAATP